MVFNNIIQKTLLTEAGRFQKKAQTLLLNFCRVINYKVTDYY
ncbi:hypothetical protein SAMN05428642_1058 [Flaviramulus basaltis]|uniref:Uncharacterized protein n=1 Tax=Flaviramulus basaltis TaxID=369401 RepID=A0A1K2IR32_9FLAO|nr:hypothetical protein SAMN05428642_1058 [Flaviramulus basaltis]